MVFWVRGGIAPRIMLGADLQTPAHSIFRLGRNFSLAALGLWVEGFIYFAGIAALLPRSIRAIGWSNDGLEIGGRMIIFTVRSLLFRAFFLPALTCALPRLLASSLHSHCLPM